MARRASARGHLRGDRCKGQQRSNGRCRCTVEATEGDGALHLCGLVVGQGAAAVGSVHLYGGDERRQLTLTRVSTAMRRAERRRLRAMHVRSEEWDGRDGIWGRRGQACGSGLGRACNIIACGTLLWLQGAARAAACAAPTGPSTSGASCGEGSSGEDAGTPPLCGRSATLGLGAGERLSRGDL